MYTRTPSAQFARDSFYSIAYGWSLRAATYVTIGDGIKYIQPVFDIIQTQEAREDLDVLQLHERLHTMARALIPRPLHGEGFIIFGRIDSYVISFGSSTLEHKSIHVVDACDLSRWDCSSSAAVFYLRIQELHFNLSVLAYSKSTSIHEVHGDYGSFVRLQGANGAQTPAWNLRSSGSLPAGTPNGRRFRGGTH